MGNNQSVTPNMKIPLTDLPENELKKLLEPDYTVLRSSGKEEAGWKISTTPHTFNREVCDAVPSGSSARCCSSEHDGNATRSIGGSRGDYGFRIFASRSDTTHDAFCGNRGRCHGGCAPCCGWRPCYPGRRHIWPTHLTTQEQKEEWWAWLDSIFSGLKSEAEIARAAYLDEQAEIAATNSRLRELEAQLTPASIEAQLTPASIEAAQKVLPWPLGHGEDAATLAQDLARSPKEACRFDEHYYNMAEEARIICVKEAERIAERVKSVCRGCRNGTEARCPPCDTAIEASITANQRATLATKKAESLHLKWNTALAEARLRRAAAGYANEKGASVSWADIEKNP